MNRLIDKTSSYYYNWRYGCFRFNCIVKELELMFAKFYFNELFSLHFNSRSKVMFSNCWRHQKHVKPCFNIYFTRPMYTLLKMIPTIRSSNIMIYFLIFYQIQREVFIHSNGSPCKKFDLKRFSSGQFLCTALFFFWDRDFKAE